MSHSFPTRRSSDLRGRLTGTGMSIGTPHYMSPEQARAQATDGRSDMYSLGVVAYQCLVGAVPFDGEDSFSIGYKHIMEELPVPALEAPDQQEMFQVVQKMMAKKREHRHTTLWEFLKDFRSKKVFKILPKPPRPERKLTPPPPRSSSAEIGRAHV